MRRDRAVRITQRLERSDLFALRRDEPRHDDVEQERRHRQEDRRQHRAHHVLLLDFVGQHRVRGLVGATDRLAPAVGAQAQRQGGDHLTLRRPRREADRDAVERALHVERRLERLRVDPEDAEAALIGHAPQPGEDVLGRQRDALDHQRAALAVHQRAEPGAGLEAMRHREGFRHQRRDRAIAGPCPGAAGLIQRAAGANRHPVHARRLAAVQADELADDRVGLALDLDPHRHFRRRLHVGDAGDGAQHFDERQRRALDAREHVGKAAGGVVVVARLRERVHRRQRGDEAADAAAHHERDRERLAPHQRQVAQQFAVERFHHGATTTTQTATTCARCARRVARGRRRGRSRGRPCRRSRRCA